MRRTALIFGLLLTLTAGVWSRALAVVVNACCLNETSAPNAAAAPAPDEHDCCRARFDAPDAPHSEATEHAREAATHEDAHSPEPQTGGAHASVDCAGANEPESATKAAAFGERGRSCLECCAGRSNQMPTNATINAPEQSRGRRAVAGVSMSARDLFAPDAHGVAHLSPSQHAPPASRERRHILNSVFLI